MKKSQNSQNFASFTGKHLYWSLFLIKLQAWGTPTQVFSWKICEIFKNIYFYRTPLVTVSVCNTIHHLEMEEWSPWSNCSCGYQTRKRKCLMDDCFTFKKQENQSCIQLNCTGVTSLYFKKILIYHLQAQTIHHKKPRFWLYYAHPGRKDLKISIT